MTTWAMTKGLRLPGASGVIWRVGGFKRKYIDLFVMLNNAVTLRKCRT